MTGVVVDVGDGATHVVPVADGYVIGGSIKSIPIAGKDVTLFIQQLLRVFFFSSLSSALMSLGCYLFNFQVMMRNLSTLIGVTQPYLWLDLYTYALPFYMLRFQTPSPYLCQYHASFQLLFGLCCIFFEETQCHFTYMWFIFLNFLPILLLPFEEMLVLV